jgi:hypothetical protein
VDEAGGYGPLDQQFCDEVDKPLSGFDRGAGPIQRNFRVGAKLIIGDCLQIVGLGQKPREITQLRLIPGKLGNEPMDAPVRFSDHAATYNDQRPSGVKASEISVASGIFANASLKYDPRANQAIAGFSEVFAGFRRHKSMP